ncbi:MAG: hypothetical protein M3203_17475 [Actinomycetota bacterium]|nr:hypothetical protein [Actinomycetota bacterium]
MDNGTLAVRYDDIEGRNRHLRIGAVIAALALMFAMTVLIQPRAEAAPVAAVAAASVVTAGAGAAQIDFNQIFCSIILSIRNRFAQIPFFAFILPIFNQLLARFGCVVSPAA